MNQMSINQFLSIIRNPEAGEETFTLRFVRSGKKNKGEIAMVAKCRYGAPVQRHRRSTRRTAEDTPAWMHNEKGTLPMTDAERNRYFTPLISHIIGFNDYIIMH